jgi:hypothetical protein
MFCDLNACSDGIFDAGEVIIMGREVCTTSK